MSSAKKNPRGIQLTKEQVVKLARLYQEKEILWKRDCEEHSDKNAVTAALEDIVKQLDVPGLTATIVRKKLRNMRDTYQKTRRNKRTNRIYSDILDGFLGSYYSKMDNEKKIAKKKNSDNSISTSVKQEHEDDRNMDISESFFQADHDSESTSSAISDSLLDTEVSNSGFAAIKSELSDDEAEQPGSVPQSNLENQNCEEEYDCFGKFVAYTLKNMTRVDAIITESQVQEVLSRIQLEELQSNTT